MLDDSQKRADVVIVGAGPAGLSAAAAACQNGKSVCIVDDNPAVGGQIWRGEAASDHTPAGRLLARLKSAGAEICCGTQVIQKDTAHRSLIAERFGAPLQLKYSTLVVATGARERLLPFPGWTLPNVMASGGLQSLVKAGFPIAGKRLVVAGSGPLLLAVAAYLRKHGAHILCICEQASWRALAGIAGTLLAQPGKMKQALLLRGDLAGVPFWPNSWPVRAHGDGKLESLVVSHRGKRLEFQADYLACGFHLVPNTELASLLGCRLENSYVAVDDRQQTSLADVFCAGEPTGIGGLDLALVSGEIAGRSATGAGPVDDYQLRRLRRAQRFASVLGKACQLRSELKELPDAATFICRCEDVTHARAARCASWREAKNQTRCGMGPCQGRVCGPATQFLYGWEAGTVRPPIYPASLATMAALAHDPDSLS